MNGRIKEQSDVEMNQVNNRQELTTLQPLFSQFIESMLILNQSLTSATCLNLDSDASYSLVCSAFMHLLRLQIRRLLMSVQSSMQVESWYIDHAASRRTNTNHAETSENLRPIPD